MDISMEGVLLLTDKYDSGKSRLKLCLAPNEEQMVMMVSSSQAKLDIKGHFCVRRKEKEDLMKEL